MRGCSRRYATRASAPASAAGRCRSGRSTGSCSSRTSRTSRIPAAAPPVRSPAPGSCASSWTASRGCISTSPEPRTSRGRAPATRRDRQGLASGCSRSFCSNAPALDSCAGGTPRPRPAACGPLCPGRYHGPSHDRTRHVGTGYHRSRHDARVAPDVRAGNHARSVSQGLPLHVHTRLDSPLERAHVGVVSGQSDIADYRAGYATRTRSGFGVSLLADWASIGGSSPSITTPPFGTSDIWLKADYVPPGGRVGASFQVSSSSWHRATASDNRVDGWRQDRRDRLLRFFVAKRDDGLGWRLTASLGTSGISHDTLVTRRAVSFANLEASQTWRTATVSGVARFGATGAPQQFEARAGWMPLSPITLAGSFRQSFYTANRYGWRAYGTTGLALPLGFSARAEASWQEDAEAALVTTDAMHRTLDVAAWLRFENRLLTVEVGRGRRDPFAPLGFAQGIKSVGSLSPTPLTEFVAAHATLHVVPGVTLTGWYFDPVVGGGDLEPLRHGRVSVTFYSKFWRVFKSGIFALRGEVAMESWSRSAFGGLDTAGGLLGMTGSSFVDTNLEMQLAGVTLFWNVTNVNIMRSSYVPGLGYPKSVQQYGARWFFTN